MTVYIENLHLAVNRKQGTQTLVSYAQDSATTIKESIKAVTITSLAKSDGIHYLIQQFPWHHYNAEREQRTCLVRR